VAGRLSPRRAVERNAIPIARQLARESKLPYISVSEAALLGSGPNANIPRLLAAAQVNALTDQKDDQTVPKLKSTDGMLFDPPKIANTAKTFRLDILKKDGSTEEITVVVDEMTIDTKHAKPEYCWKVRWLVHTPYTYCPYNIQVFSTYLTS
jgi:hypothetical protein